MVGVVIGLVECFEDDIQLFVGNVDVGVIDFELDVVVVVGMYVQVDFVMFGEFYCVGQQVFQDLLQLLVVNYYLGWCQGVGFDLQGQVFLLCYWFECFVQVLQCVFDYDYFIGQFDMVGFDV